MINLLHFLSFLGISNAKGAFSVAPSCSEEVESSQCCVVAQIWNKLSPNKVYLQSPTACCEGSTSQNPKMKFIYCRPDGKISRILWYQMSLTGPIPPEIGKLTNLKVL